MADDHSMEVPDPDHAILALYRGPLDDFIKRRDALAKELRASKRRDDADRAKALRKPSRTAWTLDSVVHDDPEPVEQLAAAIVAAQTAQSGAEVRTALENVRAAVRNVATAGARASIKAGHPMEANALMAAVHAVIGDAQAFADLRAGMLVDIPEGGGLDILTAITLAAPASPAVAEPSKTQPETRAQPETPSAKQAEQAAAATRIELQRAEALLAAARERVQDAERAVLNAQAKLNAAEQKLHHAQEEANARRADLDRTRREVQSAESNVQDAERAVADVRARLK